MTDNNELKAKEFLEYIAKNEKELKYSLSKNITYDKEIFDDAFSETIIKIYNSILKNGTTVNDFRNYFFISAKWTYALFDNRNKKKQNREIRDYFNTTDISNVDEINKEEKQNEIIKGISKLKTELINHFGEDKTSLFFEYFNAKINGGISYKKLAEKNKLDSKYISSTLQEIKKYINNSELNKLKKILHSEYALY